MEFQFHCDLSYDGSRRGSVKGQPHLPTTYVFAGLFASQEVWRFIESRWIRVNKKFGVERFHASHLNEKTGEYKGWDDARKIEYSAEVLQILDGAGKDLEAVSCGMFADDYREVISAEGRRKMGSPYIACFNSCITRVAKAMDANSFPSGAIFSALIDEDDEYRLAIQRFDQIRDNPNFAHRRRMGTCTPGNMRLTPSLQPADLIAYEIFKWMMDVRKNPEVKSNPRRYPLQRMLKHNSVAEGYWNKRILTKMRDQIEATPSMDSGLVIIPEN